MILGLLVLLSLGLFSGCSDDEETGTDYYIRFTIAGTNYSFEQGISGINPNNGTNMTGYPAAYNYDGAGMISLKVYATKLKTSVDTLNDQTNTFIGFDVNQDCTNVGQFNNVTFNLQLPGIYGIYYNNNPITITEFGAVDSGVITGTFAITLTNEIQQNEITLETGTFSVKRLAYEAGQSLSLR